MKEEDYDAVVGSLCNGYWFPIHRAFIARLGLEAAACLHFLINFHERIRGSSGYVWREGWFTFTCKTFLKEMAVKAAAQTRILSQLEEHNLIEMDKRGLPARRHIRINSRKIDIIMRKWGGEERRKRRRKNEEIPSDPEIGATKDPEIGATKDPEIGVTPNREGEGKGYYKKSSSKKLLERGQSKKTVRRTGVRRSQGNNLFSGQEAKGPDQKRMEALANKIRSVVKEDFPTLPMVRSRKREQYVEQLRRLVKTGYSLEEVETVFSWWLEHHGDEYVRKIRSLADIYDEFSVIKQLMKSAKEISPNGNGQVHKLSNGRRITADNMYESENCHAPGIPRIWADHDGKQYDGKLVDRVRSRCQKVCGGRLYVSQEELDAVLKELGEELGCIPITVAGG